MKKYIVIAFVLLIAIIALLVYFGFIGVTHKDIHRAVCDESQKIQDRIDARYQALDRKLDRIDGKLDKLLEIANRPLPDGMQKAR